MYVGAGWGESALLLTPGLCLWRCSGLCSASFAAVPRRWFCYAVAMASTPLVVGAAEARPVAPAVVTALQAEAARHAAALTPRTLTTAHTHATGMSNEDRGILAGLDSLQYGNGQAPVQQPTDAEEPLVRQQCNAQAHTPCCCGQATHTTCVLRACMCVADG